MRMTPSPTQAFVKTMADFEPHKLGLFERLWGYRRPESYTPHVSAFSDLHADLVQQTTGTSSWRSACEREAANLKRLFQDASIRHSIYSNTYEGRARTSVDLNPYVSASLTEHAARSFTSAYTQLATYAAGQTRLARWALKASALTGWDVGRFHFNPALRTVAHNPVATVAATAFLGSMVIGAMM